MPESAFDVDISGLLRVFGGHLYSSPGVFVRELVQNAHDAILEARAAGKAAGTVVVRLDAAAGAIEFEDDGVGLDDEGIRLGLGRLGWSSKRREGRPAEVIGQFGIGLLSGFLVSETLTVTTQKQGGAPLVWRANRSGAYTIEPGKPAAVGTVVRLTLDDAHQSYRDPAVLRGLLERYTRYLPLDVYFEHAGARERVSVPAPWLSEDEDAWTSHLRSRGVRAPLVFRLKTPHATGFAWIHEGRADMNGARVDVYHHGMLLEPGARELLPEWAGFVSAIVEAPHLSPTASRETFVRDETFDALRAELRGAVLQFLVDVAHANDGRFGDLLHTHHLFLRGACVESRELMVALGHRMPFDTNFGEMDLTTFREVAGDKGALRIVETAQEFAHTAPLATAQGVGVINASYVHDTRFLQAFAELHGASVVRMTRDELSLLVQPAPDLMKVYEKVRRAAEPLLASMDVVVEVGRFEPSAVPAFLLTDATQLRERAKALIMGSESPLVKSLLSGLAVAQGEKKTRFILNGNNPLVQALPGSSDPAATGHIVRLLYLQSAMMFRRTLSIAESRGFTEDLLSLLGKLLVPSGKDVN